MSFPTTAESADYREPMIPGPSRGRHLRRHLGVGIAVVLVAVGAAGCSDDTASPATAPSATEPTQSSGDPADGVDVEGEGWSLTAPPGWADSTDTVKARFAQVDAAAGDTAVAGDFADNVNVIVSDKRRIRTQRKAERILRRELRLVGKDVTVHEPAELDGKTAYHATARIKVGRTTVRTSQYFARHDEAWYLLTFSYGPSTDAETEAEEVRSMLDSWSWAD